MDKAVYVFEKIASSYVDVNSWNQLKPLVDKTDFKRTLHSQKRKNYNFPAGLALHSKGKELIMLNPKAFYYSPGGKFNKDMYDTIHVHELTHAIRRKKNTLGRRLKAIPDIYKPKSTLNKIKSVKNRVLQSTGTFIEEMAAQKRMMKRSKMPLSWKVPELLYPFESAVGMIRHKNTKFNTLRKLLKKFLI